MAQAAAACRGGAAAVQLRCKHATDREALDWGERIRAVTREHGTLFFVNDRFDLALLLDADGVHLGQDDVPPARIPAAARERLLLGRSTHTPEQLERACREPVDYVAFGPVYGTTSKDSAFEARGTEAVERAARTAAPLPLVAIGGIDAARAPALARAGAAGVAVISTVADAADPETATRALVRAFAGGGD